MGESKNNIDRPKPHERVCYNCKNMLWMVGIGQGVRCGFNLVADKLPPMIPHLRHTCENFELLNKLE